MTVEMIVRLRSIRRHAGITVLMAYAIFAVSPCTTSAVTVIVNPNGTFTPNPVNIQAGEQIQWVGLTRTDSIVQIGDVRKFPFPASDPCGIRDNHLDHAFAATDPNEFTGPSRKGVSGIFALGPNEPGLVQKLSTETCTCETLDEPCVPLQVDSLDRNSYKLCPNEGPILGTLDTTWTNPDLTGVIIRINWSDIQIDNNGVIEFRWDDLDRELNKAVANGKLFTLDVRAGKGGTPTWIFNNYPGPAGPGPVTPLTLKDWASEASPTRNNCGFDFTLGSPMHTNYRDLYVAMINELATHVASDSRWFQALAHVKISGANLLSSEARLPKRCYDENPSDGILDTIGRDDCLCNSKIWATEGDYTPSRLYEYYRVIGNTIYNAFLQRKSMGYQLIQAGFPRVESLANFQGDSLRDQQGNLLLDPPGVTSDDLGPFIQTKTILQEGREGRFIDPQQVGPLSNPVEGKLFVPQHSGISRLPEDDDPAASCSQAVAVDPVTQRARFPIATGTDGDGGPGCPNRWAVEEGTLYSQIMGFQTHNPSELGSGVESALWNLTINSNGVFIELYEQPLWEIYHSRGTGPTAAVLDPCRMTRKAKPAPFSKNLFTWSEELHDRRKIVVDPTNPHLGDPFPAFYTHTFSKAITLPETYYYINPLLSKISSQQASGL
ncbi:MAG: hypothetical protein P0120_00140 [Nitrospira sp.]|nr:hypothetical protein [Nitrospira sp.]